LKKPLKILEKNTMQIAMKVLKTMDFQRFLLYNTTMKQEGWRRDGKERESTQSRRNGRYPSADAK
jgi:hypothetical protein